MMEIAHALVTRFRKVMGQSIGVCHQGICSIGFPFADHKGVELAAKLIEEEAAETVKALREGNLVEAIDGICDTIFVCLGAASYLGVTNISPFFLEVCHTNLLKANGPVREDGKRMKPEGWKPPRIAEILNLLERGASRLDTQLKKLTFDGLYRRTLADLLLSPGLDIKCVD